jgi:hypothetical protein
MPGILDSFDPAKMTAKVQPAIRGIFRQKDGSAKIVTMPQCLDVPVQFIGGGGFSHTFPLAQGDEGLLVFASRCIDAWWQSGGVQNPVEIRADQLSDAFFIPGFRSVPRVLSNISTTTTQLRSDDGTMFVEVGPDQIQLKHPTKVTVDSPEAHFTGKITSVGDINSDGTVKGAVDTVAGTISGKSHKHTGVTAGGAQTGTPV